MSGPVGTSRNQQEAQRQPTANVSQVWPRDRRVGGAARTHLRLQEPPPAGNNQEHDGNNQHALHQFGHPGGGDGNPGVGESQIRESREDVVTADLGSRQRRFDKLVDRDHDPALRSSKLRRIAFE